MTNTQVKAVKRTVAKATGQRATAQVKRAYVVLKDGTIQFV